MYFISGGPDSSAGIATRYGLDGPGIESQIPMQGRQEQHVQDQSTWRSPDGSVIDEGTTHGSHVITQLSRYLDVIRHM
jgi:hypothetical protein